MKREVRKEAEQKQLCEKISFNIAFEFKWFLFCFYLIKEEEQNDQDDWQMEQRGSW
jgi:hypothetical protein